MSTVWGKLSEHVKNQLLDLKFILKIELWLFPDEMGRVIKDREKNITWNFGDGKTPRGLQHVDICQRKGAPKVPIYCQHVFEMQRRVAKQILR